MQEIWDLFQLEALPETQDLEPEESPTNTTEQLFLALSSDAQRGSQGRRTI
jgi:hypothetical protein